MAGPDKRNIYKISIPGVARSFDRRLILLVNMVPMALALIQISSVNVAMPSIEASLDAASSDIQWVLSGYALAFGICLVPSGRLGDVIGRSSIFCAGLGIFAIASAACGLASDPLSLNVARVFQGMGAGMQGPQTVGMIQQHFRGKGRAKAYSLQGMVVAASVAVGPLATGLLITFLGADLGWRVPFLLNLPLGLLGCVLALRWLPFEAERERRHAPGKQAERRRLDLDPLGAALLTGAVVCVMLPFMLGETVGWRFWLLGAAVLLGLGWLAWEWWYGRAGHEPMVDLGLLKLRSFTHQTLVSAMDFLGVTSIFVVVAMFLQQGLGWSALQASMIGLPNAVLSCFGAMWAGKYVLAWKDKLVIGVLGIIAIGIFSSVGVVWGARDGGWSPWWLLLTFGIYGLGQGAFGAANQTLAMLNVPVPMAGTAGGVKSMTERVSTAVGNAVMTGVLFATLPYFDWHGAVMVTYGSICVVVTAALALATAYVIYERRKRTSSEDTHPRGSSAGLRPEILIQVQDDGVERTADELKGTAEADG
ncbi:MAG: MFS transporter [Propionibacteriaceae bacterium]|nr:MFS transporter [Propionibacteriaceae bacterium]